MFGNGASMNSIKATAILAMPVLAAAAAIGANVLAQEAKLPAKDYNQRALEIYEFRKTGARAGNFLLQMLVLPQRIRAGDPAAQRPLSEAQPAIGRERQ